MEISYQIKQIKHLKQYKLSEIIQGIDIRLRLKLKIQEYQKVELPNGHVITMHETRSVKKIFEGKLEGGRGRGRPRLRWINNAEDDLRKLGVKQWRTKALDREEWASIIREAKAKLKEP